MYIIKNNIKLMIRNKWTILLMLIGPIIVIAALMSAFGDLMETNYEVEPFTVGICYKEDSKYLQAQAEINKVLKDIFSEQKGSLVLYQKMDEADIQDMVHEGEVTDFIYIDDKYTIYQSDENEISGHIVAYTMYATFEQMKINDMINQGKEVNLDSDIVIGKTYEGISMPSAKDYYGKTQMMYFLWCGMICLSPVFISEKRNNLRRKFIVAPISSVKLFLGKFIPAVGVLSITVTGAILISSLAYGITWGNIPLSMLIIFLNVCASISFGLLIYQTIRNMAIAIIFQMGFTWIAGFIGGCFESYILASTPERIKCISPIYHTSRALVEYATKGSSDYTVTCIVYMLVIVVVCGVLTTLSMKKRLEAK